MENVKLFLSQKSQFGFVEKIKNRNKNRTDASLFRSSEDGKQEFFLYGLTLEGGPKGKSVMEFFGISQSVKTGIG